MTSIKFLKGSRDEFAKPNDESFEERAEIIRRHLAEVFGSKNLSFLIGSGCSSFKQGENELGIPTMGPLAQEFQATLQTVPGQPAAMSRLTRMLHYKTSWGSTSHIKIFIGT